MKYVTKRDVELPKRATTSHKGDNGTVLIIGGSIDYVGAVMLAGLAAFRTGVDLVMIAAPEKVAWAINTFSPDFITFKFKGNYFEKKHAEDVLKLMDKIDVVLIGNGIGNKKQTKDFVQELVSKIKNQKVIDANAIRMIELSKTSDAVLTPHENELADLMKNNKVKTEKELKNKIGSNVVLIKGKIDKIISKQKTTYNKTGNSSMTVGGTGDVLAGLTAGLLAQLKDGYQAAVSAAFINGEIGDRLYKKKGNGFLASEMIDEIPRTIKVMGNV